MQADFGDHGEQPVLTEYVTLPDMTPMPSKYWRDLLHQTDPVVYLKPGIYDAYGKWLGDLSQETPAGARVIVEFAGVTFVWGVFSQPLRAGQRGDMIFRNLPGTGPVTSFFTEWDVYAGYPRVSEAIFTLIASMNGRNIARIVGQNLHSEDLPAAAGFIISQNVDINERTNRKQGAMVGA